MRGANKPPVFPVREKYGKYNLIHNHSPYKQHRCVMKIFGFHKFIERQRIGDKDDKGKILQVVVEMI